MTDNIDEFLLKYQFRQSILDRIPWWARGENDNALYSEQFLDGYSNRIDECIYVC